jgi:predicted aminopeptidase
VASGALAALAVASTLALGGCANLGYYWQSASGHLQLLNAARPVDEWLRDPAAPQRLKDRLALSQRIRAFASRELGLPDNASYTRYADIGRPAVIWNVVAAPPYSLTLRTWCFPVTGCIVYRGYYAQAEAEAEAARQRADGYESDAYPVPAYSTLGWSNWVGGDPLLSTFIGYPEGELARLVFHELAHQVLYVQGDSTFNESFATAVERLGVQRWLAQEASATVREDYARYDRRRRQFRGLTLGTRKALEAVYANAALDEAGKARAKAQVMAQFRADYAQLRGTWGLPEERLRLTDQWVAKANNAAFGAQAAYDELVPGFEGLHAEVGGDWARFYDEARRLARLPKQERHEALKRKEIPGA